MGRDGERDGKRNRGGDGDRGGDRDGSGGMGDGRNWMSGGRTTGKGGNGDVGEELQDPSTGGRGVEGGGDGRGAVIREGEEYDDATVERGEEGASPRGPFSGDRGGEGVDEARHDERDVGDESGDVERTAGRDDFGESGGRPTGEGGVQITGMAQHSQPMVETKVGHEEEKKTTGTHGPEKD